MAQAIGKKSKYLIKSDYINRIRAILILVIIFLLIFGYFNIAVFGKPVSILGIILISSIFAFALLGVKKIGEGYIIGGLCFKKGREGEAKVLEELKKLTEEFYIFQDVQIPNKRGNIDFVVVGSTGIFAIEVKSHSGNIDFDGVELTEDGKIFKEKNILHQAMGEAMDLHSHLKINASKEYFINPVLVFSSPYALMRFGLKPVYKNICVVQKKFLNKLILQSSSNISQAQIEAIKNELSRIIKS